MTTSNSTTFELNRNEIIYAALRKLAAYGDGQSPTTTQITAAAQALNVMLKTFQGYGMPLWAIKEYTFSTTATETYEIGVGKLLDTPMPLKILQVYITETASGTQVPLNIYTHNDFNELSNHSTTGRPVNFMYEVLAKYGIMHLWPIPDTATISGTEVTIVYQRPFEEFVSSTDTPDFPSYWTEALIYGLAWRLAPEYGIPPNDRSTLGKEAEAFKQIALEFGGEEGSFYIQPDWAGQ